MHPPYLDCAVHTHTRVCSPAIFPITELWSLLHFLMPYIFRSRKEFSYWFANPMTSMIEGTASNQNEDVVRRLHGIIRPFVLRRLKKDVETQLPGKFEHIVKCQLSRRQVRPPIVGSCICFNYVSKVLTPIIFTLFARCLSTKSSWRDRQRDKL